MYAITLVHVLLIALTYWYAECGEYWFFYTEEVGPPCSRLWTTALNDLLIRYRTSGLQRYQAFLSVEVPRKVQ